MKNGYINTVLLPPFCLVLLLGGCGGGKLWPFGEGQAQGRSNAPANSTEYQCNAGKKFYVRMLDKGNTAWLILPDREVSLAKAASGSVARFSNGISTLSMNGDEATLDVSPAVSLTGCKARK